MQNIQNNEKSFGSKLLVAERLKNHKHRIDEINHSNPINLKKLKNSKSNINYNVNHVNFQRSNVMSVTNRNSMNFKSINSLNSNEKPIKVVKKSEWTDQFNNSTQTNRKSHKDKRNQFENNYKNMKNRFESNKKTNGIKSLKNLDLKQNTLSGFGEKKQIDKYLSRSFTKSRPIFSEPFQRNVEKCFQSDYFQVLNRSFTEGFSNFKKSDNIRFKSAIKKEKRKKDLTQYKAIQSINQKQCPKTFNMSQKLSKFKKWKNELEKDEENHKMFNVFKRLNNIQDTY